MVKAGKWYVVAGSQPKRSFEQVQTHSAASVSQPRRTWAPLPRGYRKWLLSTGEQERDHFKRTEREVLTGSYIGHSVLVSEATALG